MNLSSFLSLLLLLPFKQRDDSSYFFPQTNAIGSTFSLKVEKYYRET
jgi:hypothetical protein